jgi:hypothetical protein
MRLADLDARFIKLDPAQPGSFWTEGVPLAEAHGVMFLCPVCFAAAGNDVGVHSVICWFADRGVPADMTPKPGRWRPAGTGIDDLTFVGPDAASVLLMSGCNAHFFVRDGAIV